VAVPFLDASAAATREKKIRKKEQKIRFSDHVKSNHVPECVIIILFLLGDIKQIAFAGGKVGGSSQFMQTHGYHCAFQAQGQPGQCKAPWANKRYKFPALVFYQFSKFVHASKLAFSSRTDCCLNQSPSNFDIIASNDADCNAASNWVTIKEVRGVKWTKQNQTKSWDFDDDNVAFSCWGIRCLADQSDGFCSIQNLKLENDLHGEKTTAELNKLQ
jgi:hypothetical protein